MTQKLVLKYDNNKKSYLIEDREVEKDVWIRTKNCWEIEEAYNRIQKYVEKYGFTSHKYYTKNNIEIWVFTNV